MLEQKMAGASGGLI
jgi:hypothetical protein